MIDRNQLIEALSDMNYITSDDFVDYVYECIKKGMIDVTCLEDSIVINAVDLLGASDYFE